MFPVACACTSSIRELRVNRNLFNSMSFQAKEQSDGSVFRRFLLFCIWLFSREILLFMRGFGCFQTELVVFGLYAVSASNLLVLGGLGV